MTATTKTLRSEAERDELVEQYLPLVRYVVARLPVTMPATLNRDDFFSVGVVGLIHAATTYDPERGASFKTFAFTAVRGAILDEIRRHDPVPRSRRDRLRRLDRATATLQSELGRPPTLEEVAERLETSASSLDEDLLALHTCRTLSLDDAHGGSEDAGISLASRLENSDSVDPVSQVGQHEQIELLAKAVSELPESERHVVVLYHFENLFLKEIGEIIGVTESRVSQILTRATARLQDKLKRDEDG